MKITKYNHACMFVEENGKKLVIDPGDLTELPEDISNITVIVVTHIHPDHLGVENIKKLVAANPDLTIVANIDVLQQLSDVDVKKEQVDAGIVKKIGGFDLELFTGDHAVIYKTSPCKNLRVVVNNKLYSPGDSYVPLGRKVAAVAVAA
jgi:L-ascorbate metabolism protein UlaG (beta-lactamase superfamily)